MGTANQRPHYYYEAGVGKALQKALSELIFSICLFLTTICVLTSFSRTVCGVNL